MVKGVTVSFDIKFKSLFTSGIIWSYDFGGLGVLQTDCRQIYNLFWQVHTGLRHSSHSVLVQLSQGLHGVRSFEEKYLFAQLL